MTTYKTLNQDVKLTPAQNNKYDITIENKDYKNITGLESLNNACKIAILTRYHELHTNPIYKNFGCRLHELIKDNQTKLHLYKLETYTRETLEKMRRIKTVNSINITQNESQSFIITFNITSIDDQNITGELII